MMKDELSDIKFTKPVDVEFQLYKSGKRVVDKSNFISIIAKFLFDSLTHYGCIKDDSDLYIKNEHTNPTIYNADGDYCLVSFTEVCD